MKPGFYKREGSNVVLFLLDRRIGFCIVGNGDTLSEEYSEDWKDSFIIKIEPTTIYLNTLRQIYKKITSRTNKIAINAFLTSHVPINIIDIIIKDLIVHIPNVIIFNIIDVLFIKYDENTITLQFKDYKTELYTDNKGITKIVDLYMAKKSKTGHLGPRQS